MNLEVLAQDEALPDPDVKQGRFHLVNEEDPVKKLVDRYSKWDRLKRGVAWMIRLRSILLGRAKGKRTSKKGGLSVAELKETEQSIIIWVQRQSFPDVEKKAKCNGLQGTWRGIAFNKLSPMLVDGVLRVGGRLSYTKIGYDQKHPVILPPESHVTKHHTLVGHMGAGMTWTSLRNSYWVIRGGAAVRKIIGKCFACRKTNVPPSQQYMADLPAARVNPD